MADAYMTSTDVAKFNDADLDIGIVSDVLNDAPLLAAMAARSIPGSPKFNVAKSGINVCNLQHKNKFSHSGHGH